MSTRYILGVDSSTSATKAIVFDVQGNIHAAASRPHAIYTPAPGWTERLGSDL